jgi:Fe-S-cluster-containing hydrogenase component 2
MTVKIDYAKCCWQDGKCTSCDCGGACTGCLEVCPVNAISRKDVVIIDEAKCIDCGSCVAACKHEALSL